MRGLLGLPDAETPQDGYAPVFSAAVGRALWKPITGALLSGFAAGLVAFGAAGGTAGTGLTTDATLSYSDGVLAATSLKASSLTSGRVPFAGTGGLLGDSANLTYSGGTLSNAGGDIAVSGKFLPNNSVSAYLNSSQAAMYGSTGSGSFPFNQSGNAVLEARGGASPRAVVLASAGGSFTAYLDAVGTFNVPATTASSSTTTGACVVSGGMGVGGAINAGGNIASAGASITLVNSSAGGTVFSARNDDTTSSTSVEFDVIGTTTGGAGRNAVRLVHQANLGAGNAAYLSQSGKVSAILFEDAATVINQREGGPLIFGVNDTEIARFRSDGSGFDLASGKVLKVNGTQVIGARDTGWTAMTGSPDKATAYATSTITLAQLAGRVAQLQASLTTHGLFGA